MLFTEHDGISMSPNIRWISIMEMLKHGNWKGGTVESMKCNILYALDYFFKDKYWRLDMLWAWVEAHPRLSVARWALADEWLCSKYGSCNLLPPSCTHTCPHYTICPWRWCERICHMPSEMQDSDDTLWSVKNKMRMLFLPESIFSCWSYFLDS